VVRTLLAGESLHKAEAKLNEYRPFTLAMKPTRPQVPIYVAALKQQSITSIGELADGWIPTFWPYDQLQRGIDWIAEGAQKAGRDPSEITVSPFTTVIPLGDLGKKKAKELIAFYIGGMGDYYYQLLASFGYEDTCKQVAALYADKGTRKQAADAVSDAMMEALCVAGDPQHCVAELRRRRDFGMQLPLVTLPPDTPWQMTEMFIRGLAPRS